MAQFESMSTEFLGKRKRRNPVEDDDEDFDVEGYFANYVPLSNLPTPPAPNPSISAAPTLPVEAANDELLGKVLPLLLAAILPILISTSAYPPPGPATFLGNLLPQSSSLSRPSPHITSTYLHRANLPRPTLALTACILDSLSGFFVRTWTRELASLTPSTSTPSFSTRTDARTRPPKPKPDLLILAALSIASSFLSDIRRETRYWASRVAKGNVEAREVDATVRVMLRDMDYGLLGFSPGDVEAMAGLMFGMGAAEAGTESETETETEKGWADVVAPGRGEVQRPRLAGLGTRATVVREGLLTPELSPPEDGDERGGEKWRDLGSI